MLDVRVGSCSVLGYVMNDVTSKLGQVSVAVFIAAVFMCVS